jgi:hypothetical protein
MLSVAMNSLDNCSTTSRADLVRNFLPKMSSSQVQTSSSGSVAASRGNGSPAASANDGSKTKACFRSAFGLDPCCPSACEQVPIVVDLRQPRRLGTNPPSSPAARSASYSAMFSSRRTASSSESRPFSNSDSASNCFCSAAPDLALPPQTLGLLGQRLAAAECRHGMKVLQTASQIVSHVQIVPLQRVILAEDKERDLALRPILRKPLVSNCPRPPHWAFLRASKRNRHLESCHPTLVPRNARRVTAATHPR